MLPITIRFSVDGASRFGPVTMMTTTGATYVNLTEIVALWETLWHRHTLSCRCLKTTKESHIRHPLCSTGTATKEMAHTRTSHIFTYPR
jgi:hypothetical protein